MTFFSQLLHAGRRSLKRASKANGNLEDRTTQLRFESFASQADGIMRELKRQKNLIHGALESFKSKDQIQPLATYSKPVGSSCDLELKYGKVRGALLPAIPDGSHVYFHFANPLKSRR